MKARLPALLLLAIAACAPRPARVARRLEGRYALGEPGEGWQRVKPGGADYAWWNPSLGATIYADSNCGPRFHDAEPRRMAEQLLLGLAESEELRSEELELAQRAAWLAVRRGTMDGVEVEVGAVVVNRGNCNYDMVYIARPEHFDQGWPAFERVYRGFDAEAGR